MTDIAQFAITALFCIGIALILAGGLGWAVRE